VDGAAEGGLEPAPRDVGVRQRVAHGDDPEGGETAVGEAAEGMQADARDVDRPHGVGVRVGSGAKADDRTGVPSSSANSGSMTSCTARPGRRRDGSDSVSRVITRSPSASSTTPKPYGTGPRYPGGRFDTTVKSLRQPSGPTKVSVAFSAPQYGHVGVAGKWRAAHEGQRAARSRGPSGPTAKRRGAIGRGCGMLTHHSRPECAGKRNENSSPGSRTAC